MTVSTEISSNEYTGNGLTTDFDYKFRIFKAEHLSVTTSDADGDNLVSLRLGTDYTVTGVNKSAGGKIVLSKPLASGHKISIARELPITQETSFRNQSKFFAETHENSFDYLTMILQRIWGNLGSLYLKRPNILANWYDAKGYRIANLGKPKRNSDAVDLGTLKDEIEGVNGTILKREKRVLRVDDMDISALPKANERAGNVLTFDKDGRPIVVAPASGSAVDVLNQLSKNQGMALVGGSIYVVNTFSEALNSFGVRSAVIKTLCHHIQGKGSAEYVRTGNMGMPMSGDELVFCNADGVEWKLSNKSVDYYMFGAELDGVTDDTLNIMKAHEYANIIHGKLIQTGGVALVRPNPTDKQIKINTSCDFTSDFTFLLDTDTLRGFIFRDEMWEIKLNQSDVNIDEFKVSRMGLPSLSKYAMYYAVILSNEVDLNRKRTSGDAFQFKKQPVVIGHRGVLNAPLWTTFNSIDQILLQSITIPTITINGLCIKTLGDINSASPVIVRRNNVNFNNVKYINGETNELIPVQNLIAYEYSLNSHIDGIACDSLSKGIIDNNYVVNTWCSTNINIRNMTSFDGWAQLDGNYCRGITLRDSEIDRAGSHFRGYDYTFENLTTRKGRCIAVSGGGLLYVRNIKQYIDSAIVADEQYTTVSLRADYGAEWDGVIDVDGITMDFTNFYSDKIDTSATVVSSFIDSSVGVHNFQRSVKLARSITVKNVKFILSPTMTRAYMRAVGVGCTSSIVSGVSYPNSITVDNVSCSNLGGVNKFKLRGVEWNTVSRNEEFKNRAKISISNVQNIDPAAYNETILDETRHLFNVITTGENSIITADINNCHFGSVNVSGKGITVNYSGGSITYFSGEINDKTMINFDNATFYGTRFRGAIKVTVSSCCFANYIDITGSSVPIGNGQNVDTNIVYIQNTRTEQGATIASQAINANNAKTGYTLTSHFK